MDCKEEEAGEKIKPDFLLVKRIFCFTSSIEFEPDGQADRLVVESRLSETWETAWKKSKL